jgi:cytochrome c-type biogenesis protein CcmF
MSQVGSFALIVALALSGYSFLGGLYALIRKGPGSAQLNETARRAGIASFVAVFLGALVLVVSAFRNDFSIAYIYQHSNRDLPLPYKFATLWSGQEGSLLFWSLLLSGYGLVLRLRYKTDERLFAHASVVIAAVQVFFLLLLNFAARPFSIMQGNIPADGAGLNPLLQYPEMVIHPPMLYLGYVGFTVPFAFALGALAMKYPGDKWIHITRRWTMVTWGFLTLGIPLGMGPGRECVADAVAYRHGVSAFSHDAGKARHAENVEHVAGIHDVHAVDFRDFPDAQRRGQFGSRVCAVFNRRLVRCVSGHNSGGVRVSVLEES